MRLGRARAGAVAAAAAMTMLAACGGSNGGSDGNPPTGPATTVTATPTASASASASTSASASSSTPATPTPSSTESLGGACENVLPISTVDQAVGTKVIGRTAFVVDRPDVSLRQVERINCRYGIATVKPATAVAKVEVSVSLYENARQATRRVTATADEWRGHGAVPHEVPVASAKGTVLVGYGIPLLVVASGARTVAVSVLPNLVAPAKLDVVLSRLAAAALRGAGG